MSFLFYTCDILFLETLVVSEGLLEEKREMSPLPPFIQQMFTEYLWQGTQVSICSVSQQQRPLSHYQFMGFKEG